MKSRINGSLMGEYQSLKADLIAMMIMMDSHNQECARL
jgi:hypothetical protein